MAARTLTYTINMGPGPAGSPSGNIKAPHSGTTTLAWDFNSGTGKLGTLSDTVLLGKIPNGALISHKVVRFGVAPATSGGSWALTLLVPEALGTLSAYATLVASTSAGAAIATFQDFIPYKLSLSDDRAVQYAVLALNCTTGPTETVSFSFQGFIQYQTDGSSV